ncbi:hypothetical protein ACFPLB_04385 [Aquamicrobium segne]|uniref:Uncharacterized protein n=1 Tax=Aquamicrobium segne TaxID=469547 RepID=A0ABW0GZL9_9HYPH
MPIIKPSTAFKSEADWVSAEVRAYIKDQVSTHVDVVQDVRNNDFEETRFLYVRSKDATYRLELSNGSPDDGDTVLHDNLGRRYVKALGSGGVRPWDVQVDALADRDAYDNEAAGFVVLVSDAGEGRAAVFTMGDGGVGDWSDPAYLTGPADTVTAGLLTTHKNDHNNPHAVTAAQVGATEAPESADDGNVAVFDGGSGKLKDAGFGPVDPSALALALGDKADTSAVALALADKADVSALTSHTSNTDNPHAVTADQVGAATPGKAIALAMIFGG